MTAKIQSVNVTEPRMLVIKGKEVATSIWKRAAAGRVSVNHLGIVGEARIARSLCDPEDHAIYFYPHEHYAHWQRELGREGFPYGQFGENVTCTGMLETEVRLGDVLRCGDITVRVRQPRLPCAKLDARMGQRFTGRFLRSRRVGFIASVLVPGQVAAGDEITLVQRELAEPSIDDLFRLTQLEAWDADGLARLLHSKWLPRAWREIVEHKLELARDAQGWHGLRPLRVVERQREGTHAVSLWLACPYGKPLAPFIPGQYLMVTWRPSHEDGALRRPYAITSDPADPSRYRITVQRVAGRSGSSSDQLAAAVVGQVADERATTPATLERPAGVVSTALREEVVVGDLLWVAAPRGTTTLAAVSEDSRGLCFLSEGIGVATVLPLLREWSRRLAAVPAVHLHIAPTRAQVPLLDELAQLAGPPLRRILAQREPATTASGFEASAVGVEQLQGDPPLALVRGLAAAAEHVFIAGSSQFAERMTEGLQACGAVLHVERFGELE